MNTDQIKSFLEVVKYNNFTKAAQHLYINQSTVSRQIADLEKEFGAQLFIRAGGNVQLTEAGRFFAKECKDVLVRYERMKSRMTAIASGKGGKLIVGLPLNVFGMSHGFSPAKLVQEHPEADFKFIMMNSIDDVNAALLCGDIDVSVSFDFATRKIEQEMDIKYIRKCPFEFFIGERSKVPQRLDSQTLLDQELVVLRSEYQPPFLASIISKITYDKPNEITFCENYESMLMEVSSGTGIGILPEIIYEQARVGYNLRTVEVEGVRNQINYVMLSNKKNSNPMINTFYKFFVKHYMS